MPQRTLLGPLRVHLVPVVLRGGGGVVARGGLGGCPRVPEVGVLEVQGVGGGDGSALDLNEDLDVVGLPSVGHELHPAGHQLALLDEDGLLQQAPHLVPVGEGLRGGRGQPHGLRGAQEGHVKPKGQPVHHAALQDVELQRDF